MLQHTFLYPREFIFSLMSFYFISRNVADRFPHLLASLIVRSYHSTRPGEISKKWTASKEPLPLFSRLASYYHNCRKDIRLFLSLVILNFMQSLGAMNPALQKFILHNLQPLLLGSLFLLGLVLVAHPLAFAGVGLILLVGVAYLIFSYYTAPPEETPIFNSPLISPSNITLDPSDSSFDRRGGITSAPSNVLVELRRGAVLLGSEIETKELSPTEEESSHLPPKQVDIQRRGGVQLNWDVLDDLLSSSDEDEDSHSSDSIWNILNDLMTDSSRSSYSDESSSFSSDDSIVP